MRLHTETRSSPLFKQGEVWWCAIGMNVGHEMYGKGAYFTRPVLVLKKINTEMFLGLPVTSKIKTGVWYAPVSFHERARTAVLSQARVFDARRLSKRICALPENELLDVQKRFVQFYGS